MSIRGTNNATTNGSHFSIRDDAIYQALSASLTSPARDIYTRALYRLCLKFTTSEDEDEGKLEPATAFWTIFGHDTTIGNANPNSNERNSGNASDDICRKMDDSMSGPASGILSVLPFLLPPNYGSSNNRNDNPALLSLTQRHAANAGLTCGWHAYGDRGDAAVRCGKARILQYNSKDKDKKGVKVKLLSLDAMRWELCKGASFAAGNSVFVVDDINLDIRQVTVCCTKGPIKGKFIDIAASRCPFVFGRAHEADLCVMDRELSRRHGAIVYIPPCNAKPRGAFVLVDLESTNGSYMRLVGPYGARGIGAVSMGDEFIVGRTGFSVNRFDFGISESIGARPTMEDRTVVIQSLLQLVDFTTSNGNPNTDKLDHTEVAMTSFCGVFDGHGGDECSNYLVDALPENIKNFMLAEKESLKQSIETSTRQAQSKNVNAAQMAEDAASEIMRRILKAAYLKTDNDFILPRGAPQSGSTAATVILFGRRLFAANVGDSRVVLCRNGGQCVELTSDHKPSRPDEAARVRAAGGFILHKRVMGELAITRAFGDKSFKMGIKAMLEEDGEYNDDMGMSHAHENGNGSTNDGIHMNSHNHSNGRDRDLTAPLVSAEPEIASTILSHQDEFLLLACDGLFDVFRSQDAIALARQELIAHRGEPAEVARILSDQAIRVRRSRDNVSILIVVFRPFWKEG